MNRELKIPGIYKHFKHTEDGIPNNYMYTVVGISEPLEEEWLSDYTKLLKELKNSKYCRPLDDNLKFNFVTIPLWGTKHKQYKLNGEVYSHIENLSIDSI